MVLAFGSVPLKTYLPDGDIDLTAISIPNSEEALASEVQSALQVEEQNKDAEFEVKSVQFIHAEVKLVKCLVQNIVVDISFNQIGGLSTLCFLEQVDHLIGKNNLFKRSIILIKAWCYYESRILGAHHSLISTYALETLVLYIFHLFHSSLHGPLAVLYRFLDYYSKFDWDNYCISLYGPISLSSLPELVAEAPENDGGDLLLSKEFLQCCINMFSDSPRWLENNSKTFQQKHLNIVDPLKENNNLGRSVSKGNFYRIRSAFMYGARKLGGILGLPTESIADEVNMFFMNALGRHGSGERPDVQDDSLSLPDSTVSNYEVDSMSSELTVDICREDKLISGKPTRDSHGALSDKISKISISNSDKEHGTGIPAYEHPSNQEVNPSLLQKCTKMDSNGPVEPNVVSARVIADDAAGDIATSKASGSGSSSSIETTKVSVSHNETFTSSSRKAYHAPRLFFHPEDGISARPSTSNQEISANVHPDSYDTESSMRGASWYDSQGIPIPSGSVDGSVESSWSMYQLGFTHQSDCSLANDEGIGSNGWSKPNNLEDLTGDFDMHFKSLLYAQCCRESFLGRESFVAPHLPVFQPPLHYHSRHSWDPVHRHSMYAQMTANGVVSGPPFPSAGCHSVNSPLIPYGMGNIPKQRGTGTYIPNANYRAYKERQHTGRGRNGVPGNQLQRSHSNVRAEMTTDTKNTEKTTLDLLAQVPASSGNDCGKGNGVPGNQLQRSRSNVRAEMTTDTKNTDKTTLDLLAQVPASSGNDCGKPVPLDVPKSPQTVSKGLSDVNGSLFPPARKVEFGTFGPVPLGASSSAGKRSDSVSTQGQCSEPASSASTVQRPVANAIPERRRQSYELKDHNDFPPLTS